MQVSSVSRTGEPIRFVQSSEQDSSFVIQQVAADERLDEIDASVSAGKDQVKEEYYG